MSGERSFDVVIVGGAAIGAAIAYFLKGVERFGGSVALVERDPTFRTAATTLSAAGIRQQFSTPENIRLSRFGLDFLRSMPARHGPEADPNLHEGGYLILASADGRAALQENHRTQLAEDAPILLLEQSELAARFPWLNTDGVEAGGFGTSGEGWFDNNTLLKTLRQGAREAGTALLTGEVDAIDVVANRACGVRLADTSRLECGFLVNAA